MKPWLPFEESIRLAGRPTTGSDADRVLPPAIAAEDAQRQEATARAILRRFADRPGQVLADEVGMGKTYVALAVAVSVALAHPRRQPVVVMVPPSLKEKWPRDFGVFKEKCLPPELGERLRPASAETGVQFLGLLDDPVERRASIIFLTHGAMHRALADSWVKLAIIQRALHGRHHVDDLRRGLERCLSKLLWLGWVERRSEDIWGRLLSSPPGEWLGILRKRGIGPNGDPKPETDDDPVPEKVIEVLDTFDTTEVFETLKQIPLRYSKTWEERVSAAREMLTEQLKAVWTECLSRLKLTLPLLIMDEAHHLKNPKTQLASLFQLPEARADAEEVARGALGGVFERMLFLTATPFQLGHHELCSVLERFEGIAWKSAGAPAMDRPTFRAQVAELRARLDAAQQSALNLDASWGSLRSSDLIVGGTPRANVDDWWGAAKVGGDLSPAGERVRKDYCATLQGMRKAEEALQPWVLRHLKPRQFHGQARRVKLPGASIIEDAPAATETGMELSGPALLPFLLAARATVCNPEARPVFAEGLASSYQAFLHTRKKATEASDGDDDPQDGNSTGDAEAADWYLQHLEKMLPLHDFQASAAHPKVSATAKRALAAWAAGEKVVVFCHYIETGRVLRQVISSLMQVEIERRAAEKLSCATEQVAERLERLGERFFDTDSPARKAADAQVQEILTRYPGLAEFAPTLLDVTRRYLRTPAFLVRHFQLSDDRLDAESVRAAFARSDGSGLDLQSVLRGFFEFLAYRCGSEERGQYVTAIQTIQTGGISSRDRSGVFASDELQGGAPERLLPNVRLVNGATSQETRQRLMLTFNSPFFPEVLIASSVMAEGVDLHRFCRYVIHHDLCWNPSTLEQRTGRLDRIGAKVELCRQPIRVYLPYLGETQDEKMYRVVMDRERWFSVVMGEQYKVDARTTDRLAERLPLPASLANELAFRLDVAGRNSAATAFVNPESGAEHAMGRS